MKCKNCLSYSNGLEICPICGTRLEKTGVISSFKGNKYLTSMLVRLETLVKKEKIKNVLICLLKMLQKNSNFISKSCELLIKKINGR